MKVVEEIKVRHVRNIIQILEYWNEGDRFEGDGEMIKEARLVHVYESKDKIFKTTATGYVLSSEFKK